MIEFNRFTLPNGLRVIHNYDSATAMVALNVLYDVGGRDESAELTGMAHLFEHLMFGGSVNIPDFDGAMEAAGGCNNAYTSNDYTDFYDVVPAHNAETAFWLESDRMLSLAFSDKALDVQKNVVIEEFKQVCLNKPYGDAMHYLRPMLYKTHPYRNPVIGKEISHIERVTQEDVRDFFYSHYAPNNAVLSVSGRISVEDTYRLAMKWMGGIPRRDVKKRGYVPEPLPSNPQRETVYGRVPQAMIIKAFPMPGYYSDDYVVCDIVTDLLASGRSSRFYRNLLMGTDLFTEVDASISGSDEPGFLMLTAKLRNDSEENIARAEEEMVHEALSLSCGSLTGYELERAVNRFESNFTFSTMDFLSKAQSLAMSEMHGEDMNDTVSRYRAITVEDVKRVTEKIINPEYSSTLIYRPKR